MVIYPPLCASVRWWANYLYGCYSSALIDSSVSGNLTDPFLNPSSIVTANSSLSSPKDMARFSLATKDRELILSVPVEGGSKQLKNHAYEELHLSEHGNWRHTIPAALDAILGRSPIYRYIEPSLKECFQNKEIKTLPQLNFAIFQLLKAFLIGEIRPSDFNLFFDKSVINNSEENRHKHQVLIGRGKELVEKISPEISILQPLSNYGPETLLALCVMLTL